jgi:hypothetical protein
MIDVIVHVRKHDALPSFKLLFVKTPEPTRVQNENVLASNSYLGDGNQIFSVKGQKTELFDRNMERSNANAG